MTEKTYNKRLGRLNISLGDPVVTTEDGRAWMTMKGVILVFPDHWGDPKSDCHDPYLTPLPKGVDVVTTNGQKFTT